jgi:hypothetical protein
LLKFNYLDTPFKKFKIDSANMAAKTSNTKFYIGLIKPHDGVAFSAEYKKNISTHGSFQLYTDLLEVDAESVILVLAALKGNNIIKMCPDKNQKGQEKNGVTLVTQDSGKDGYFAQEQLQITIDSSFVGRVLKQTKLKSKLNFEALDMKKVMCCYFSIDEMNDLKIKSIAKDGTCAVRKTREKEFEDSCVEFPGEKINFLENYDKGKMSRSKTKSKNVSTQAEGVTMKKEGLLNDHKYFYDLDGHKHVVHATSKNKLKEEKKKGKWWNRLSEPRLRLDMSKVETEVDNAMVPELNFDPSLE